MLERTGLGLSPLWDHELSDGRGAIFPLRSPPHIRQRGRPRKELLK